MKSLEQIQTVLEAESEACYLHCEQESKNLEKKNFISFYLCFIHGQFSPFYNPLLYYINLSIHHCVVFEINICYAITIYHSQHCYSGKSMV